MNRAEGVMVDDARSLRASHRNELKMTASDPRTNPLARESRGAHHYNTDDDAREATPATRRYRRSPSGRGRDQSFVPAVNRSSYSQALQPSLEFASATAYATR